jgi:hypothetical protein
VPWFRSLAEGRGEGFSQPPPISWLEMQAWAALQAVELQPWEAQLLRRMDVVWRAAWAKGRPADRNTKK